MPKFSISWFACLVAVGSLAAAEVVVVEGGVATVTGVDPTTAPATDQVRIGGGQVRLGQTGQAVGDQAVRGDDPRLSNARPANGGNAATIGGLSPSNLVQVSQKNQPNGVPGLDANGKIGVALLPPEALNGEGGGGSGMGAPILIEGAVTLDISAFGKLHLISGTSSHYMINLPSANLNNGGIISFTVDKWAAANKLYGITGIQPTQRVDGKQAVTLIHTNYLELMALNGHWVSRVKKVDTDWTSDGELIISATTTNPVKASTRPVDSVIWRREGSDLLIEWQYSQNAGGSSGSGVYTLPVPAGFEVPYWKPSVLALGQSLTDLNKWQSHCVGHGSIGHNSVLCVAMIHLLTPTSFAVTQVHDGATSVWGSASDRKLANVVRFSGSARVPIFNWGY